MSKYNSLVKDVTGQFERYEITRPVRTIQHFVIEEVSNWYVRNNRRRFWAKADDPSKMAAYLTLYRILTGICQLTAPVTPFLSELLWKELTGENRQKHGLPLSVHMTSFPKADDSLIDEKLEETMGIAESIVSLGRAARSRTNLKVRQPLSRLMVKLPSGIPLERLDGLLNVIKDELNVKAVLTATDLDQYVTYSAKLNFKAAGPKLGGDVKAAAAFVAGLDNNAVKTLAETKTLTFEGNSGKIGLTDEEIDIIRTEKERIRR